MALLMKNRSRGWRLFSGLPSSPSLFQFLKLSEYQWRQFLLNSSLLFNAQNPLHRHRYIQFFLPTHVQHWILVERRNKSCLVLNVFFALESQLGLAAHTNTFLLSSYLELFVVQQIIIGLDECLGEWLRRWMHFAWLRPVQISLNSRHQIAALSITVPKGESGGSTVNVL